MSETQKPKCIGIIMDGNRRWAKKQGLPSFEGHRQGYKKLKEFLAWSKTLGVEAVIAYAFSKENWRRSQEEVNNLLDLFRFALSHEIESLIKEKTRLMFVGNKNAFPADIQRMMTEAEETTRNFPGTVLAIAASYGGREEIVNAVKALAGKSTDLADFMKGLNEQKISESVWTYPLNDPDMIIRTGGEQRLSGFLPWQTVYSELFFTETLWPDMEKQEFMQLVEQYSQRKKNFGK